MTNRLYYGDNLEWLGDRAAFPDASVDLIYLDPPFNSNATYSQLFRSPDGKTADSQIEAFEDTWVWGLSAEAAWTRVRDGANTDLAQLVVAMRQFLHDNAMMAYIAMMAVRLTELHRVLKPTGSLYLHCDPTASHYLKLVLDAVFGVANYRNEITWKRTGVHNDSKTWSRVADILFFYTKGDTFTWNTPITPHTEAYIASHYSSVDSTGRQYQLTSLLSPAPRPRMMYAWKGFPSPSMGWRFSIDRMTELDDAGLIWYPRRADGELDLSKRPRFIRYRDEQAGTAITSIWTDIPPINARAAERLGYPTQKPLALLQRIIAASSNPGDVVLDPFCGCGTAVHAAEKLGRRWAGIDITHLSIALIEKRLRDAFPGLAFTTEGLPKSLADAEELARRDKHEFQKWVVTWLGARPWKGGQKGPDGGIDGLLFFNGYDAAAGKATHEKAIVSVKGGQTKGVNFIESLVETIGREKAALGILIMAALPTREMEKRAAAAGFFETGLHAQVPRIQILTLAELFAGKRPIIPNVSPAMFKAAPEETGQATLI